MQLYRNAQFFISGSIDETGGVRYQAPDVEIDYLTPGDPKIKTYYGPGSSPITMDVEIVDWFSFSFNNGTRRNGNISPSRVVPGVTYNGTNFVTFGASSSRDFVNHIEYRSRVYGDVTEVFDFPYEVQPVTLFWQNYNGTDTIRNYTLTIVDGSGNERNVTKDILAGVYGRRITLKSELSAGERIKRVEINYDSIISSQGMYGVSTIFGYYIPETHEDGTAIEPGELFQVKFDGKFNEVTPTGDASTDATTDQIWFMAIEKKCPYLTKEGAYQTVRATPAREKVTLLTKLSLRGDEVGAYRRYMDHPVIDIDILNYRTHLTNLTENEPALTFLSGEMTLTSNMSEWDLHYDLYAPATGTTRSVVYHIPELTEDFNLTRELLGVRDGEYFTKFQFQYDGVFQFKQTDVYITESSNYEETVLIRNIAVQVRNENFNGEHLTTNFTDSNYLIIIVPSISHGGNCDTSEHLNGRKQTAPGHANMSLIPSKHYPISGPNFSIPASVTVNRTNFSVTPSVSQGGSLIKIFQFAPTVNGYIYGGPGYFLPLPLACPEAIYIELTDPNLSVDLENTLFLKNLADHGMTPDDVSEISAGGKKWLKLSVDRLNWSTGLTDGYVVNTGFSNAMAVSMPFVIALRVSPAHDVGITNPFGEVYYDMGSTLPAYYQNDEKDDPRESWRTVSLVGAVPDKYGLLGDGDTETERLWYGDASGEAVTILPSSIHGAVLYPGKNGKAEISGSVTFLRDERGTLFAEAEVLSPSHTIPSYDYETVFTLPSAGTAGADGTLNEYTLNLSGPFAITHSSITAEDSTPVVTYSKDGVNWVTENEVGDWSEYRKIKVTIAKILPYHGVEAEFPVEVADADKTYAEDESKTARIEGVWKCRDTRDGDYSVDQLIPPAQYVMAPYIDLSAVKTLSSHDNAYSYPYGHGTYQAELTALHGEVNKARIDAEDVPMPYGTTSVSVLRDFSAAVGSNGTVTGGDALFAYLEYDTPGTYEYNLAEVIPESGKPGVTFSESQYHISVTVTQGDDDSLKIAVSGVSDKTGTFTNHYSIENLDWELTAAKTMTDDSGSLRDAAGFTFLLEEKQADGSWEELSTAASENLDSDLIAEIPFDDFVFTQHDFNLQKVYEYRVSEIIPDEAVRTEVSGHDVYTLRGVSYDQSLFRVVVTLADQGDGTMKAVVDRFRVKSADGIELAAEVPVDEIIFTNTYHTESDAVFTASKDLAGRPWEENDAFSFQLTAVSGVKADGTAIAAAEMPVPASDTAQAAAHHRTAAFDAIRLTADMIGNTYTYEITEPVPAEPEAELRYDSSKYDAVIEVIKDNGDGTIDYEIKYYLHAQDEQGHDVRVHVDEPIFLNRHILPNMAAAFTAKRFTGRENDAWLDSDSFTMIIEPVNGITASGASIPQSEVPMPKDESGQYKPRASVVINRNTEGEEPEHGIYLASFEQNRYEQSMEGNVYYYKMYELIPCPDGNTRCGSISYDTREFRIRVTVTVDHDSHAVIPVVEYEFEDEDGDMIWTGEPADAFHNIYQADPVTLNIRAEKVLHAPVDENDSKYYYPFGSDVFSFTLVGTGDAPMPKDESGEPKTSITAAAGASTVDSEGHLTDPGLVIFEEIEFTETGVYTYILHENLPLDEDGEETAEKDGITYAHAAHTVTVTVTDDNTGRLTAEVDGIPRFENIYRIDEEEMTIHVIKTVNGHSDEKEFSFLLIPVSNGQEEISKTMHSHDTGEEGIYTFDPIDFVQTDIGKTYSFHIREVLPQNEAGEDVSQLDGITYDRGEYKIDLRPEDNGDGTMTIQKVIVKTKNFDGAEIPDPEQTECSDISFNNIYRAEKDLQLPVKKELIGTDWGLTDTFEFLLEAVTIDAPMPETGGERITLTAAEKDEGGVFGAIRFAQDHDEQSFVYKITEISGTDTDIEDLIYDETVYYAQVYVSHIGDGELEFETEFYFIEPDEEESIPVKNPVFSNYAIPDPLRITITGNKILTMDEETIPIPEEAFEMLLTEDDENDKSGYQEIENAIAQVNEEGEFAFAPILFTQPGSYHFVISEIDGGLPGYSYDDHEADITLTVYLDEADNALKAMEGSDIDAGYFSNSYKPEPARHDPPVRKVIEGQADASDVVFTFVLEPSDPDFPMPDGHTGGSKEVTITGSGSAEFGIIEFTETGVYEYTVTEVKGDEANYTYDSSEYTIRYVVIDNNGQLEAVRTFFKDGKEVDEMTWGVFTNVYEKDEPDEPDKPDFPDFFRIDGELPKTGFSAMHATALSEQPDRVSYSAAGLTLMLPKLDVGAAIITIPYEDGQYPVEWLGDSVGLLEGSAYPGEGFAILTGHNHLNTMEAGPFALLATMNEGDMIFTLNARGEMMRFSVYAVEKIDANDIAALEQIAVEYPNSLTLMTCEDERPDGGYAARRIVAARPLD